MCPVITQSTVDRSARVRERGQVAAGVGLAEQLAPQLLGREDGREPPRRCSGVPWANSVGPDQVDADAADQLGRPGAGQLLVDHDEVLGGAEPPAA